MLKHFLIENYTKIFFVCHLMPKLLPATGGYFLEYYTSDVLGTFVFVILFGLKLGVTDSSTLDARLGDTKTLRTWSRPVAVKSDYFNCQIKKKLSSVQRCVQTLTKCEFETDRTLSGLLDLEIFQLFCLEPRYKVQKSAKNFK